MEENLKPIDTEELKKIQLQILDAVSDFCEKHQIKYWLDCGTLLGAVRHKGYIPWDDDIDIGMLRPDYDKFMQLFNLENDRYKFYSYENNKNFLYPYGKVLDTDTVLYEPDKHGIKLSVNIDVFIYDNAPDNDRKVNKMFRKRDFYLRMNILRNFKIKSKKRLVQLSKFFIIPFIKLFPKDYFVKRIVINSRQFVDFSTNRIGNFTAYSKMVCNRNVFNQMISIEFEGKKYNAPIGYEEWLTAFYGDYMQLPPEEKRVSHHKFEAYLKVKNA